jgi:hypothetical protein
MTLAIGCITADYTIQVSDRRLVWLTGSNAGKVADDDRNKVVVVCNRVALSYTGLAEIGREKTDDWLLEVASKIVPYNPQRLLNALSEAATAAFRRIRLPSSKKRHAFLISGWARFNDREAPLTPFVCAVSDALDDNWSWNREASDTFRILMSPLVGRPFRVAAVGQTIPPDIRNRLMRQIRAYVSREGSPVPYIEILAQAIRAVAESKSNVGKNLMAVSLPRSALGRTGAS